MTGGQAMTFEQWWDNGHRLDGIADAARKAWEAATAAERERCAKLCDACVVAQGSMDDYYRSGWNDAAAECAASIRQSANA